SAALCEAFRLPLAIAPDAFHRRTWLRMPGQGAGPSTRLRATLRLALVRARTTPDVLRAKRQHVRHAPRDGKRPQRALLTPPTLRPLREGGCAPRHALSGARPACSAQAMRFLPPP